jgi:hypothetical protein
MTDTMMSQILTVPPGTLCYVYIFCHLIFFLQETEAPMELYDGSFETKHPDARKINVTR